MKHYGTENHLLENNLYTATLRIGGEERVITFTSSYNPMFSSARLVRSDFRQLFADVDNDTINRLIHENSKLASEMSEATIDSEEVPYAVKQFVRYKTELDLATDLFLTVTANGGQEDRQLGDLRIVKQTQMNQLKSAIGILEKRVDSWEAQVVGMRGRPTSGVRAGSTEYPIETRVGF